LPGVPGEDLMKFPSPVGLEIYRTGSGIQICGDSKDVLPQLPSESVDLIITSPPFALLREKSYGNESQAEYINWLLTFGRAAHRVLKETGSFVLDLGGAYERGRPVRSLYNYRVLIEFCDRLGYRLAEEFFWHNPAKLPSPIEWVNKRKIRVKDSVNTVWWFSKSDFPKADVTRVLAPYSPRMNALLKNAAKFYQPKMRPSGHDISKRFDKDNGGAIPGNLLQIANTDSNSHYLRMCKKQGVESHPARFPEALPQFFVDYLTAPNDVVLDIFSGSNTTGCVAERSGREWISIEMDRQFAVASALRFMERWDDERIKRCMERLRNGEQLDLSAEGPLLDLPLTLDDATAHPATSGVSD
jgi:site-specific DNA-methyltransferase (cytosine-N4-specific)